MTKEEIENNFEQARKYLAVLEELSMAQNDSYLVHNQRLEGVKFLWNRIQVLRAIESAQLEQEVEVVKPPENPEPESE